VNSFVTLALFDLNRGNFTTTNPSIFQVFQIGKTCSRGVYFEDVAGLDFGLDLIASYAYHDVEIEKSFGSAEIGKRPTQVAEQTACLWADYTI
jgi:iron complex outermembrane receptor protein